MAEPRSPASPEAVARWPLTGLTAIHRYGRIAPGANIVLVLAASAHRQAAFEAASFLMDYLKSRRRSGRRNIAPTDRRDWVEAKAADDQRRRAGKRHNFGRTRPCLVRNPRFRSRGRVERGPMLSGIEEFFIFGFMPLMIGIFAAPPVADGREPSAASSPSRLRLPAGRRRRDVELVEQRRGESRAGAHYQSRLAGGGGSRNSRSV